MKPIIENGLVYIPNKHCITVMLVDDVWETVWDFDRSKEMPRKKKKELRAFIGFKSKQIEELYKLVDEDYISQLLVGQEDLNP